MSELEPGPGGAPMYQLTIHSVCAMCGEPIHPERFPAAYRPTSGVPGVDRSLDWGWCHAAGCGPRDTPVGPSPHPRVPERLEAVHRLLVKLPTTMAVEVLRVDLAA